MRRQHSGPLVVAVHCSASDLECLGPDILGFVSRSRLGGCSIISLHMTSNIRTPPQPRTRYNHVFVHVEVSKSVFLFHDDSWEYSLLLPKPCFGSGREIGAALPKDPLHWKCLGLSYFSYEYVKSYVPMDGLFQGAVAAVRLLTLERGATELPSQETQKDCWQTQLRVLGAACSP